MTSLSSFTQVNYPRKAVIDGDTVVVQTIQQTRWVSIQLEVAKSCLMASAIKDSIIKEHEQKEKTFNELVKTKDLMIADRDSSINDYKFIIDQKDQMYKDLKKENGQLRTKNTIILIVSGIITALAIFY